MSLRWLSLSLVLFACRGERPAPTPSPAIDAPIAETRPVDAAAPERSSSVDAGDLPKPLLAVSDLVTLSNAPDAFEVDAKGNAWFLTRGDPTLWIQRLPASAAKLEDFGSETRGPGALRIDGTDVVWFSNEAHVIGWSRNGSAPRRVQIPAGRIIADVVVRDGVLHHLTHLPTKSESAPWGKDGTLTRVALDTGASTVVASGIAGPDALAVDATTLFYWSRGEAQLHALGGGKNEVVWSLAPPSSGVGLDGPENDSGALRPARFLYVDAESFWFVDRLGATFELARKSGTRTKVSPPARLVDAKWVYWLADDATLVRRPRAGGPIETLAREPSPPILLLTKTGNRVYWVAQTGNYSRKVRSIAVPP